MAILSALALAACSSGSKGATPATTPPTIPSVGAVLPGTTTVAQTVNPCTLLTVAEATKLAGHPVKLTRGGGPGALLCVYTGGGAGAEVTVKVDTDAAAAHAEFPSWVQPLGGQATGLILKAVPNLGDEASETRYRDVNDGIYVRKGASLIKIGAYPPATDAALRAAAATALGRL